MDSIFLGKPFKTVTLGLVMILIGLCGIGPNSAGAQNWDDSRLLMDLQKGGAELFKEVSPSVVQIFNLDYQNWSGGSGSGYVIDKEGHAITNKHVVGTSQVFEVAFFGDEDTGKRHKAKIIGQDPQLDLAVIKIETDPENLHPIKIADTANVKIGDVVATLGSPGGDAGIIDPGDQSYGSGNWLDFFNFNVGVVDEILDFHHTFFLYAYTGTQGREQMGQYYGSGVQYLYHVSAAINHGNSGGPCINANGEVIGTNTWGMQGENVGYTVPTNLLKRGVTDIIAFGRVKTPWLGILCHNPEPDYDWFQNEGQTGITNKWQLWFDVEVDVPQVMEVNSYSPAYEAGIRKGDRILSVNGMRFNNVFELYKFILNSRVGDKVTLMIERGGVGFPPIAVELAEKKVRYDKVKIDSLSMVQWTNPYITRLTY